MGLDTTHDCWHGPYSAFARFRAEVLAAAGPLPFIESFSDDGEETDGYRFTREYPMRCFLGWWDDDFSYADPLEVFFVHSDCDGMIYHRDCKPLAAALKPLRERMAATSPGLFAPRDKLQRFIDGLELAYEEGEDVRFH